MRTINEIKDMISVKLNKYIEDFNIPGMSIGIVLEGKLAYAQGFGVKSIASEEEVSDTSMFHGASISKTFVATALMQLCERGLLRLDDKVVKHLPYLKLKDDRYKEITIRQMLSHTSGMPDVYDYEWDKPQYADDALENYIRSCYDFELMWEPGENYAYSNLAYEMLGALISSVSGMSFEQYIKENVLKPAGMDISSFLITDIPKKVLTTPHILNVVGGFGPKISEHYPYNRIHAPSSALCSNAVELSKYAIAHLAKGKNEACRLLKPESYDMMWKIHADTKRDNTSIGLGWFIREYKDQPVVFHNGGDTGYGSSMILLPEISAAFVMYVNCDYANIYRLANSIIDIIMGYEVKPVASSAAYELTKCYMKAGMDAAVKRFDEIKRMDKNKYYIEEGEFNALSYEFLYSGKADSAIDILKLGIIEFPNAANLYDSIGEMYRVKGDIENSIINYKKSVALNPNNKYGIKALEEMGTEI